MYVQMGKNGVFLGIFVKKVTKSVISVRKSDEKMYVQMGKKGTKLVKNKPFLGVFMVILSKIWNFMSLCHFFIKYCAKNIKIYNKNIRNFCKFF